MFDLTNKLLHKIIKHKWTVGHYINIKSLLFLKSKQLINKIIISLIIDLPKVKKYITTFYFLQFISCFAAAIFRLCTFIQSKLYFYFIVLSLSNNCEYVHICYSIQANKILFNFNCVSGVPIRR